MSNPIRATKEKSYLYRCLVTVFWFERNEPEE